MGKDVGVGEEGGELQQAVLEALGEGIKQQFSQTGDQEALDHDLDEANIVAILLVVVLIIVFILLSCCCCHRRKPKSA